MDKKIGTSQQTLVLTSTADTNAHNYYFSRFVSPPLKGITSITAQTWTYKFAAKESSTSANFPVTGTNKSVNMTLYVWRPGTGKLGNIFDGATTGATLDEGSANQQAAHVITFSGAQVLSVQDGDVICCEIWFVVTQGASTAFTDTFYYDGTTEDIENATATNSASLVSTPQDLTFAYTQTIATETVASSETLARVVGNIRAPATETTTVSETLTRSFGAVRRMGGRSILFDGSNDYIDCTNDATLWSGSITKYSMSCWVYLTAVGGSFRDIIDHGGGSAFAFNLGLTTAGDKFQHTVRDGVPTQFQARPINTITTNVWYHIVCVYDNSLGSANVKIYQDKVAGTVTANTTATLSLSATLFISKDTSDLAGNLKDFRFWKNKALTQTEIDDVYNNSTSAPTPDYWLKMEEGTGNPIDAISGTKVGTLTNGATWATVAPTAWPENTTVSDSLSRMLAATRNPQETITLSENLAYEKTTPHTDYTTSLPTETTTISESLTRMLAAFRTSPETTTVSESLSRMLAASRPLSTETTSVSESLTRILAAVRALSTETVSIGELLNRMLAANRAMSTETITISDAVARLLAANRLLSDTTNVSDSIDAARLFIRTLATETVTVSESLTRMLAATRNPQETVAVSESLITKLSAFRTLTETTSISDSIDAARLFIRTLSESVTISESLTKMLAATRNPQETVAISESLTRLLTSTRTLIENTDILDNLVRSYGASRTLSDSTTVGDSVSRLYGAVRALAIETISIGDSISKKLSAFRTLVENINVTDSLNRVYGTFTNLIENIGISDSVDAIVIVAHDFVRSITETVNISERLNAYSQKLRTLNRYLRGEWTETDPSTEDIS